jgi:hypothetical protein
LFVPLKIKEWLRKYLDWILAENETTTMSYPPPIAKTIGFELIEIGQASAALKMQTDPAVHGNPMGTVHGGVLCDIADGDLCHFAEGVEGQRSKLTRAIAVSNCQPRQQ